MASSLRSAFLIGFLALGLAAGVEAQGFSVTGRAVRVTGPDTTALAGEWVVLHRVAVDGGAPLDSQRTGRTGRYTLRAPARDTLASYLVSVRYEGINYFGEAFRAPVGSVDSMPTVLVYDTSSTSPPIELAERHVIIRSGAEARGRRAIEIIVLANRGDRTRITNDSGGHTWRITLPRGAVSLEFGAGDLSDRAIRQRGDTLEVIAALPPGVKQFLIGYLVPPEVRRLSIPIDQPTARLSVMVEDTGADVDGAGVSFREWEELEGVRFRRFAAEDVAPGTAVTVRFAARLPFDPLVILVPLAVLALLGGLGLWWHRHGDRAAEAPADDPARLAQDIATLDREFAGRETADYRRRRAELKARLTAALARQGRSR